jgi:molecular chaperone Hsp33
MKHVDARDQLHVFLFEDIAARGAIVQLDESWRFIRSLRSYPPTLESLLGESIVAAALLSSTFKSESSNLLLQIQSEGPLRLLVAECTSDLGLRCMARFDDDLRPAPLDVLARNGRCAITVGTHEQSNRYQGVVPLDRPTIAAALEDYMERSEQLDTRLILFADTQDASGLLLQRIPGRTDADEDGWNRVVHLGSTVSADELRSLTAAMILRRLFPEEDIRIFEGRPMRYRCTCSGDRVMGMLRSLGKDEVDATIAQQGRIEVTCEFCGQTYRVSATQAQGLFPG